MFEIIKYSDHYRDQLLHVWERSVLATHTFLQADDFKAIGEIVKTINFNAFDVFCLVDEDSKLVGFVGVADKKVEMLFIVPEYTGKGGGKLLMNFAMAELKADKVDVNEQNTNAVGFYRSFGFETYERTERDDQGYAYPLLRMKLASAR